MERKKNLSAQARSPSSDINSIPEIYDKTKKVVAYIDDLSGHDPEVSKAISSSSTVAIYTRESTVDNPFLVQDEIMIDSVNRMSQLSEMLDDGTWPDSSHQCPHAKECGNSSCETCLFAQIRTVNVKRLRCSLSLNAELRVPVLGM